MAQKLWTLLMKVAEVLVREVFKILVAVKVDRVPELRLAVVQVID